MLTDLLKGKDIPVLHVHVHVFNDATCIGIHIPHAVVDTLGLGIIVRAWVKLINAEDPKTVVLPFVVEGDPLADWGSRSYPSESAARAQVKANTVAQLFGWWDKLRCYIPIAWELLTSKEIARSVFIPHSVVDRLRKEKWVSENDIVIAILAHVGVSEERFHHVLTPPTSCTFFRAHLPQSPYPSASWETCVASSLHSVESPTLYTLGTVSALCVPSSDL